MADLKISALTGATTPLAGTEVLPIVQSSTTKKVSVANLTAGRAVSMASAAIGSGATTLGTVEIQTGATTAALWVQTGGTNNTYTIADFRNGSNTPCLQVLGDGNVNLPAGNLVIGTSGKGIDFSATSGSGTSELLNDYEEGTWTPSIGGTATYTAQTGRYTKVGRLVTFMGDLTINVQGTGNAGLISGLPFTVLGNNSVYVGYFANLGQAVSSISPFTGGTDVLLYGILVAASTATNLTIMTNGARLMFQGSYEV
jgi:hypothetical protein